MEEQLIGLNTSLLAMQAGFDVPTEKCFAIAKTNTHEPTDPIPEMWYDSLHDTDQFVSWQPTQSLLQKWLREKHNIFIDIQSQVAKRRLTFAIDIKPASIFKDGYSSYEEALKAGLQEALKLITK